MDPKELFDIYIGDERNRFAIGKKGENILTFIGINPHQADLFTSDRTTTRCLNLSESKGYDGFLLVNLCPIRDKSPDNLKESDCSLLNSKNIEVIKNVVSEYNPNDIVAAWGDAIDDFKFTFDALKEIIKVLPSNKFSWKYIDFLTKPGNPRHPLYSKGKLNAFDIDGYIIK